VRPRGVAACLLLAALLAAVTGCTGSAAAPVPDSATSGVSPITPEPVGKPGGTLRLVADTMPTGDPGWADDTASRQIVRLVSRQLYTYRSGLDPARVTAPVPDLAASPPVVSPDGLTETVKLRSSARWDTQGGRLITSTDVARGIKRLCEPPYPSSMRGYFAATVVGFDDYCTRLAARAPRDAPDFVENTDIPGVKVVGDDAIEFDLMAPAADFTDILALPAASAVPLEELAYPPNSTAYFDHLISDGPYHFVPSTTPGQLRLSRNPTWSIGSDSARPALADHITITTGVDAAAAQAQVEAGRADMALDAAVPAATVATLAQDDDPRLTTGGGYSVATLVVGLHGPSAQALDTVGARAAIAYCVDRSAVVAALGGPWVASATAQLLGPPMVGYTPTDPYPTAGFRGDPQRCRAGLAAAPGGPVRALTLVTTTGAGDRAVAAALVGAFARGGVTLGVRALTPADYRWRTADPTVQDWDLALTTIAPAWFGQAGRTVYQPLLEPAWTGQRPADGGYRLPGALAAALRATKADASAQAWQSLESTVLTDAAIIPLADVSVARFHSANVRGYLALPSLGDADPTAVSLGIP
jgi:peptide/nickel transport system substrate-binding protein